MNETIETKWAGNMAFESNIDGFLLKMDTDAQFGGTGYGPRPKPMVLAALSGCTGMDVISILAKKRVPVRSLNIRATGEIRETHPKSYSRIHLVFELTGENFEGDQLVHEKVERAIQLSYENYCAVSAMLRQSVEITHDIRLINA